MEKKNSGKVGHADTDLQHGGALELNKYLGYSL